MDELGSLLEEEVLESNSISIIETDSTIDTLDIVQVKQFISSVEALREEDDGIRLWVLLKRLPIVNSAVGLGHTMTRILKYLNTSNCVPECLKNKTYSTIKSKILNQALEEAFITACATKLHMTLLRKGILLPFNAHVQTLNPSSSSNLPGRNSLPNKGSFVMIINYTMKTSILFIPFFAVALMAHLLIHPLATALWESVYTATTAADRPAQLDNTDGIASSKLADADALVAVANTIKDTLDSSRFVPDHIGAAVYTLMYHKTLLNFIMFTII